MTTPRVAVLYFSQTGNTEKVARSIAEGLVAGGTRAEVLDMLKTDPAKLSGYDMVGVGAPSFYFREPIVVGQYMKRMPEGKGKHAFLFVTSGGHPANTSFHMGRTLKKRGYVVVDGFECHGYDTYPPFKGQDRYKGHPDADELGQARAFGAQLPQRSLKVAAGQREMIPIFKRHWDRFGRLSIFMRNRLIAMLVLPKKNLIAAKCTRCGLCAKHCPVNIIEMANYPVFKRGCIDCYMCERVCPEEAIACDWTFIRKKMQSAEPTKGGSQHE